MPHAQTDPATSIVERIIEHLNVAAAARSPKRLLPLRAVLELTGICRSKTYGLIALKQHPPPVKCGRSSRWLESEILAYVDRLITAGRKPVEPLKMPRPRQPGRKPRAAKLIIGEGQEANATEVRE